MNETKTSIKQKLIQKILEKYDSNDELIDLLNIDLTSLIESESERVLSEMTEEDLIDLI